MNTKVDLEKLRNELPHGAMSAIASMAGVSLNTVSFVLKGKSGNQKVLIAAAEYLEKYKSEKQAAELKLVNLLTLQ